MIDFILENKANFIIGAILAAAIVFAVVKIVRDKRAGKSCGGNCADCGKCSDCSLKRKQK